MKHTFWQNKFLNETNFITYLLLWLLKFEIFDRLIFRFIFLFPSVYVIEKHGMIPIQLKMLRWIHTSSLHIHWYYVIISKIIALVFSYNSRMCSTFSALLSKAVPTSPWIQGVKISVSIVLPTLQGIDHATYLWSHDLNQFWVNQIQSHCKKKAPMCKNRSK